MPIMVFEACVVLVRLKKPSTVCVCVCAHWGKGKYFFFFLRIGERKVLRGLGCTLVFVTAQTIVKWVVSCIGVLLIV